MREVTDPIELFRHQRAVRAFAERPVTDEELRQVLQAAVHAPSGSNTQPWHFVVVRDPDLKLAISREYELAQGERAGRAVDEAVAANGIMARAPVLIVPFVRVPERTGQAGFQTGASIYPACQNLMLAARLLGLGTVLTTTHRIRRQQIHELLGVPAGWDSAAIIPLGWPDRAYGPNKRGPLDDVVSYDGWST